MTTRIPKTALNREAYNEPALFYRSAREGMQDCLANTLESQCGSAFHQLWPHLGPFDVPQTLPVRIVNGDRGAIYEGMNADGFGMASLYKTLITRVRASIDDLMEISRQIINFPVNQDVHSDSISAQVALFQNSLNQR